MKNPNDIVQRFLPQATAAVSGNTLLVDVSPAGLAASFLALTDAALPLITMFATDERAAGGTFKIRYVFRLPGESLYLTLVMTLAGTSFPSLAAEFPAVALYEREIMTMFGLTPEGHPDPRMLILHEENWPAQTYPLRKDFAWDTKVPATKSGDYTFHKIGGEGIYEIPVGPVHAGIIEPGHFRFSVAGEEIVALEARLGWVHKGVEKLFETLPMEGKLRLAERVSGDSGFSHSLAFCEAVEALANARVPKRAQYLRVVFAELERLTMHIFDIGNIAGNGTGFSFMAAQGFRITEELRRLSDTLLGNRFWRGVNTYGGVAKNISREEAGAILTFVHNLKRDFAELIRITDTSATFANRVEGTGILSRKVVRDYGALGIAARCVGIARDVRLEHPYAAYATLIPAIALEESGDVSARFLIRIKEVLESIKLIEKALAGLSDGPVAAAVTLPASGIGIGAVEGWRGEIAYAVVVENGAISRVKVRDPSFINWRLFSHLVSKDMVPDFPLINKSLNLSYSGNDL